MQNRGFGGHELALKVKTPVLTMCSPRTRGDGPYHLILGDGPLMLGMWRQQPGGSPRTRGDGPGTFAASPPMRHSLGKVIATAAVAAAVPHDVIVGLLDRHAARDWGDLDAEDKARQGDN